MLFFLFATLVSAAPSIPGFSITWSDDFDGSGRTLPSSDWRIDTGTQYPSGPSQWGTGEIETYTNSVDNLCLTGNGLLQITPLQDTSGRWTSGRIETARSDFMAQPGEKMRIQASIMMPAVTGAAAAGYWPAFWTLGSDLRNGATWPAPGEFDIMENVDGRDTVWGTLHCGTNPGGPCNESNGLGGSVTCPNSACQGNWHTYTHEVDRSVSPETIRWYVDGQQYWSVNADQVGSSAWNQAVHSGVFILLNVAMGGGFPNGVAGTGTPTSATEPGHPMLVDYVAVYNS